MITKESLRVNLFNATGCDIQHTGWPCNTCFHNMKLPDINDDMLHDLWESVLVFRGDYKLDDIKQTSSTVDLNISLLFSALRSV